MYFLERKLIYEKHDLELLKGMDIAQSFLIPVF